MKKTPCRMAPIFQRNVPPIKMTPSFFNRAKPIIPQTPDRTKKVSSSFSIPLVLALIASGIAAFAFGFQKLEDDNLVHLSPRPDWVAHPPSFAGDINSVPVDSHGCRCLSFSRQYYYTPSQTDYLQEVFQVANEQGAEYLANYPIEFDPKGEVIAIHEVQVLRGGKVVDIHPTKQIQKSDAVEEAQSTHLRLNLGNLQIGDIVTISYTSGLTKQAIKAQGAKWHIPLFELETKVNGLIHTRLILPSEKKISYITSDSSIQPRIAAVGNGLTEYVWETHNKPSMLTENDWIQVSPFENWQEIAQIEGQYNLLPSGFKNNPPYNIYKLVEKWKKETQDPLELATNATRFVQNRISYETVDTSIEGYLRPISPEICLKKRKGDCKDKAFLLYAFLTLLNIDAKIVKVALNSHAPHLNTYLPDRQFFNHNILQFTINGTTRWVDPTLESSWHSLDNDILPEYHWGLVLDPATQGLTAIPQKTTKS